MRPTSSVTIRSCSAGTGIGCTAGHESPSVTRVTRSFRTIKKWRIDWNSMPFVPRIRLIIRPWRLTLRGMGISRYLSDAVLSVARMIKGFVRWACLFLGGGRGNFRIVIAWWISIISGFNRCSSILNLLAKKVLSTIIKRITDDQVLQSLQSDRCRLSCHAEPKTVSSARPCPHKQQ